MDRMNPDDVPAPLGNYSHVVRHGAGTRVVISGQVGVARDGAILDGLEAQMRQAHQNLLGCLQAAGMGPEHIVKMTSYCVPAGQVAVGRKIRGEILGDHKPASTWIENIGLANPDLLFEVEAEAIRED
ncbi:MAG: RidA family protein [Paracoccaceae bacterium]